MGLLSPIAGSVPSAWETLREGCEGCVVVQRPLGETPGTASCCRRPAWSPAARSTTRRSRSTPSCAASGTPALSSQHFEVCSLALGHASATPGNLQHKRFWKCCCDNRFWSQVVRSLFHIFQALGLSAVPYLPKVGNVLLRAEYRFGCLSISASSLLSEHRPDTKSQTGLQLAWL